jgi:hypothetical protein
MDRTEDCAMASSIWMARGAAALAALIAALTITAAPADAATPALFAYPSFSDPSDRALIRRSSAAIVPPALRLVERTRPYTAGSAWYANKIDVSAGWQTRFAWQLSAGPGESPEGLAFVIQEQGTATVGAAGSGLGYAGIPGSVAVAIDTTPQAHLGQPGAPFISVQTRGREANDAHTFFSLASATAPELADGRPHVLTVRYLPPDGTRETGLSIHLDDAEAPLITVPELELGALLGLLPHQPALIGLTASTGGPANVATADVSSWSFAPYATPARLAVTSAPVAGTAASTAGLGPIAVRLEDSAGNPVIAPSAVEVTLRSSSPRGVFSPGPGGPSVPALSVTIPAGHSSAPEVFYGDAIAGTPTITAAADRLGEATQHATIAAGSSHGVRLSPAEAAVTAGEVQTYTVDLLDSYGNYVRTVKDPYLTISPDGSCSGARCTATVAGPHTVSARNGLVEHKVELDVRPGPTATIALRPTSASIAAGTPGTFAVTGRDAFGNDVGPVGDVTLAIGPDGTCSAMTCRATVAGQHTVTATHGQLTTSAELMVRPGPTASIALSPASASIAAGVLQTYEVEGLDVFGNVRGPVGDLDLTIAPDGACVGAVCRATVAGAHTVTATSAGFRATATLAVRPGPRASLRLSPDAATITAGESQHYTVDAADAFGNPVAAGDVTLDIRPSGSCSGEACTPTAPGEHTVTATAGDITAAATLAVQARTMPTPDVTPAPVAPAVRERDTTPPSVTCGATPTFLLNAVNARVVASVTGGTQEQASAAADTSAVGTRTVTLTGADAAGNRTATDCTYSVVYRFHWFRTGRPAPNVVKAGRAIALTWRLTDSAGAPVRTLARARVSVAATSCGRHRALRPVKGAAGRTQRVQHLGDGNYRLKWKAPARYAGSCMRLRLDLAEGSAAAPIYHTVDLKFRSR